MLRKLLRNGKPIDLQSKIQRDLGNIQRLFQEELTSTTQPHTFDLLIGGSGLFGGSPGKNILRGYGSDGKYLPSLKNPQLSDMEGRLGLSGNKKVSFQDGMGRYGDGG